VIRNTSKSPTSLSGSYISYQPGGKSVRKISVGRSQKKTDDNWIYANLTLCLQIVLAFLAVVTIIVWIMRLPEAANFCHGSGLEKPNCIPCPASGDCTNGYLVCKPGYIRDGSTCVDDASYDKEVNSFADEITSYLAEHAGRRICGSSNTVQSLDWTGILTLLQKAHPKSTSLKTTSEDISLKKKV